MNEKRSTQSVYKIYHCKILNTKENENKLNSVEEKTDHIQKDWEL